MYISSPPTSMYLYVHVKRRASGVGFVCTHKQYVDVCATTSFQSTYLQRWIDETYRAAPLCLQLEWVYLIDISLKCTAYMCVWGGREGGGAAMVYVSVPVRACLSHCNASLSMHAPREAAKLRRTIAMRIYIREQHKHVYVHAVNMGVV